MIKTFFGAFCVTVICLAGGPVVADKNVDKNDDKNTNTVPGGVYLWPVPDGVSDVRYDNRQVMVYRGQAIVGIDIKTPAGPAELTYQQGENVQTHAFEIFDKTYTEQRLTIENNDYVSPPEETLQRIREELQRQRKLYRSFTSAKTLEQGLKKPLEGITTSLFGHRRILNGQARSPHSGLDIAADSGTPVVAAADGKITLADDLYFNGKTIFVDHGQGLITMYCHLSELNVAEGDTVLQGETIGLVGSTGRSTGPHLHWSVSLNGNRVDPLMMLELLNGAD